MSLHSIFEAPVFQAFGWAVLHFLWQGAIVALLLDLYFALARRASAANRYGAACLGMLVMLVCFGVTAMRELPSSLPGAAPPRASLNASTAELSAPGVSRMIAARPTAAAPSFPAEWIAYLWMLGVAALSCYTAFGWVRVQALKQRAISIAEMPVLDRLARRLRIRRAVSVCASTLAEVPSVVGWMKPCILLPVAALTGLTEAQLEAILAHELAHIRRHDYLVNLIQTGVETLLFYHPAVWWVGRRVRQERENCCDDIAVAVCGDPVEYATALAGMEQIRMLKPALAANGGELLARIRRLLGEPAPNTRPAGAIAVGGLILLAATVSSFALYAAPQDSQSAQFDVASVKQLDKSLPPGTPDLSFVGTSGKPFKIAGNRVSVVATLHTLIAAAYSVKEYQVSAAPSWADTLRFEITAESPGAEQPSQDQARVMLQALLADRFQLKLHRDSKELPVYHLIQSKANKKFTPAGADETFSWKVTQEPGGRLRSKATKESIGDFVQLVGVSEDRPVIDRTGITGFIDYDIVIELPGGIRVNGEGGNGPEGQNRAPAPEDLNRAIVNAVTDQLGLKLETAKDTVEMLVIDRADKPSEN